LLFLCFIDVVASAQNLSATTKQYPTLGNPTSAVATSDGQYIFVSVTNVGTPNFSGSDSVAGARTDVVSGIQIFRVGGDQLVPAGFMRTGSTGANGLVLLRGDEALVGGSGTKALRFWTYQIS
jgi:hypothetical protein